MMNIPQELGYIVQNHSSSVVSPEYLYTAAPIHGQSLLLHHPNHIHQSGGCVSSQPSSDEDLSYYNIPANSTNHPLQHFPGSENVATSLGLYGLTATPVLSTNISVITSSPAPYTPHLLHQHSITSSNHGHSHQISSSGRHHRPRSDHTHHSSHQYIEQNCSTLSDQANVASREMSGEVRVDSPSAFHHHHPKNYHHGHHPTSVSHRKRKSPISMADIDEDDSETCSSRRTTTPTDESSKKQNHSEIEKRRRDKMNTYITELSGIVPMCSAMSRKLDKLTVLRMAVQHLKTLRGSRIHSYTEGHYKPSFLSDEELKHLILQSAEGFLFVVGCDRGRLLYVSESVSQVLNYTQSDLLGQSWFDILHPKDVAKVKEQLSSPNSSQTRLIDAKTMLPVKGNVPQKANRLCPGARRSFFCRMKCKYAPTIVKEENDYNSGCQQRRKKASNCERRFCVIHCTGYLKSWTKVGVEDSEGLTGNVHNSSDDPCNLSCLVAVCRILKPITAPSPNSKHRPVTFISRHANDGKFVFVDQRTTLVVGFLPQELLGTSMYEYFHHDDIAALADVHKAVLNCHEMLTTSMYRFRTRSGDCVRLQSAWKAFRNPWTKDIEYIIARNTLTPYVIEPASSVVTKEEALPTTNEFDFFSGNGAGASRNGMGNGEIQRLINSEVPFRKIGEQIADEVVESQRRNDSSSSSSPVSVLETTALGSATISDLRIPSILSPASSNNILSSITAIPQAISPIFSSKSSQINCQGSTSNFTNARSSNSTPGAASTGSECSSGDVLTLSNRTIDPLMGSAMRASVGSATIIQTISENDSSIPSTLRNSPHETDEMLYMIGESVLQESPQVASGDGNDEAAMAVIMSLLEADAGLGGPVDFSGLPWPLP